MNLKDTILLLNEIEREFPVHEISYKGLAVWPIIRLTHSYYNTIQRKSGEEDSKSLKSYTNERKNRFAGLNIITKGLPASFLSGLLDSQANQNRPRSRVDVIYLIQHEERNQLIDGKYFSRIINSLASFGKGISSHTLEFSLSTNSNIPRYGKSEIISSLSALNYLISTLKSKLSIQTDSIKNLDRYQNFLREKKITANTDPTYLRTYFEQALAAKNTYCKILRALRPKVVFLSAFYNTQKFGLILACQELGIKTVDVQHGQQGNYHPMYTNWANIPPNGYNLLPSHFWTWGSMSAHRIREWADLTFNHEVLIGGNPWLAYQIENLSIVSQEQRDRFQKVVTNRNKVVLISLQLISDFKNSCLIEAMQNSENDTLWLLRFHPRFSERRSEVVEFLTEHNCTNFETELSNSLPIYYLFKNITHQVTFWSTVAYEALSFGVHTIIVHPNGYDAMRQYIDRGIFRFTLRANELLTILEENDFTPEGPNQYILADKNIIENAIQELATQ